jgi:peptidoglycan/xylan/chitin deacetylase (PgdA/CDA1 family)
MSQFKQHILWINKRHQIIKLDDYAALYRQSPKLLSDKFAITFDDGYRSVVELVAPFFESQQIPATFFCTTRHFEKHDLLWFVYINALCSEKSYNKISFEGRDYWLDTRKPALETWRMLIRKARESGDPIGFANNLAQKYPLPPQVMRRYKGVTEEQLQMIAKSDVLSLGGHTHNHPYLDQLSLDAQIQEMVVNNRILEDLSHAKVSHFAYTGGVYNNDSLEAVRRMGYEAAFAVNPRNIGENRIYEIPRVDIYSPSLIKFKLRSSGLHEKVRSLSRRGS